jgi:hypothetical protein
VGVACGGEVEVCGVVRVVGIQRNGEGWPAKRRNHQGACRSRFQLSAAVGPVSTHHEISLRLLQFLQPAPAKLPRCPIGQKLVLGNTRCSRQPLGRACRKGGVCVAPRGEQEPDSHDTCPSAGPLEPIDRRAQGGCGRRAALGLWCCVWCATRSRA